MATYVLSFPGGPSSVAAYLRAGWSLGSTQQRYIHEGDGGDQLTGRVACGLPINNLDFTYLPPHFKPTFVVPLEYWRTEFLNFDDFPESFRQTLPYLLASLVYHREWLQENLPPLHPVRSCYAFSSRRLDLWSDEVICKRGTSNDTNMQATGIPPTLIISQEVDKLMTRVIQLERSSQTNNENLLQYLENLMTRLPASVEERISARFAINGAIQLTREDLEQFERRILNQIANHRNQEELPNNDVDDVLNHQENNNVTDNNYQLWYYNNKFQPVPVDFRLLSMNMKTLFDYWNFGDLSRRICPYRRLRQNDLPQKLDHKRLVKARRMMKEIERRAEVENIWPRDQSITSLGHVSTNQIFRSGCENLLTKTEEGKMRRNMIFNAFRRDFEINFDSLYNDLKYLN